MRTLVLFVFCFVSAIAKAPLTNISSPPKVLVSIAPIHSLVAGVMEGIAEPELLMEAGTSAHIHQLKPSEAAKLHSAQIIIWIGPMYESALVNSISAVKKSIQLITLSDLKGIHLLPIRSFSQSAAECCCTVELSQCKSGHEPHGDHHHEISGKDGHLWLDAPNAKIIVKRVAQELAELDQRNAPRYLANSEKVIARLNELNAELTQEMNPVKAIKYVTFHDFTQYFDVTYGTQCVGVVRANPEIESTVSSHRAIRKQGVDGAKVIFSEPQFDTKAVQTIAQDAGLKYAQLDGLGVGLDKGPNLYFEMMRRFADDMISALKGQNEADCKLPFGRCAGAD